MAAGLSIDVTANGQDVATQPGPSMAPGASLQWDFAVTNTGDRPIVALNLLHDNGTPFQPADDQVAAAVPMINADADTPARGDLLATLEDQRVGKMIVDSIRPRVYMSSADENEILVLDTQSLQITQTIRLNSQPRGLDLSADSQQLYVAHHHARRDEGTISVIGAEDGELLRQIAIEGRPIDVRVAANGRLLVLTKSELLTIDASSGAIIGTPIAMDADEGELAINPARDRLYVASISAPSASLAQYDVTTSTPTLRWQSTPGSITGSNGQDLAISHDGSFVSYAAGNGQGGYRIAKFETETMQVEGFFETGAFPREITFSPDDAIAYTVSKFARIDSWNTNTFASLGSIAVPTEARELTVAANGRLLIAAFDDGLRVYATGRSTPLNAGDVDADGVFDPGETWQYRVNTIARQDAITTRTQYDARNSGGEFTSGTIENHYIGRFVALELTSELAAVSPDAAGIDQVQEDDALVWRHSALNNGSRALTNLTMQWNNHEAPDPDSDPSNNSGNTSIRSLDPNELYVSGDTDEDGVFDAGETWVFENQELADLGLNQRSLVFGAESLAFDGVVSTPFAAVTADSTNSYFGIDSRITLTTLLNGQPIADNVALEIDINSPLVWTYAITNPGNASLSNVVVTDDSGTVETEDDTAATYMSGDTNVNGMIEPDETWTFSTAPLSNLGLYSRTANVTAIDPSGLEVSAELTSDYLGIGAKTDLTVDLVDLNGQIIGSPNTGNQNTVGEDNVILRSNTSFRLQYTITNTGTRPLAATVWTGDGDIANETDPIVPSRVHGDTDSDNLFSPGETWVYLSPFLTARSGQVDYRVTATNASLDESGAAISQAPISIDASVAYTGILADIDTVVSASGQNTKPDAGNLFLPGTAIEWTYEVTNPGNVPLSNVTVSVRPQGTVDAPQTPLSLPHTTQTGLSERGTVMAEFNATQVNDIVAHPTRPYVYVSVANQNRVLVVNTLTLEIEASVGLGAGPAGMALSPDGNLLYVAHSASQTIGVMDTRTLEVLPGINVAQVPRDVEVGADGRLFVLGHANLMQLSPVNGEAVEATLPIDVAGGEITISPDRTRLYYADANQSPANLYQIDITSSPARVIWQSDESAEASGGNGQSLALSADGSLVAYATALSPLTGTGPIFGAIRVVVRNTSDMSIVGTYTLPGDAPGTFPQELTFAPDGRFVYLTAENGTVAVFGATTFSQTGSIAVDGLTREMIVEPSGRYLFTAMDNRLIVLSTGRATATINQGDLDFDQDLDPGERWIYRSSQNAEPGYHANTLTVTAVDSLGSAFTHTAEPFYIGADTLIVPPSVSGAPLFALPAGANDWILSDERFEIVDNVLRLKSDQSVSEDFDQTELALRTGPDESDTVRMFVVEVPSGPAWQNPSNAFDVNDDGFVTALDALVIINRLDAIEDSTLGARPFDFRVFYDTSGDGRITSLDVLRVINELNAADAQAAPEPLAAMPEKPFDWQSWDWQSEKDQQAQDDFPAIDWWE